MVMPSLATVDDFTDQTGIDVTDANAMQITALLTRASSAVRTATGQTISRVVNDVVTLPVGVSTLPQRPADSPSVITVNGRALTGWTLTGQAIGGLWLDPFYGMTVTYSHGYAADSIPDEIVGIVCQVAARGLQNPEGLRAYTIGNYSATYATETLGPLALTAGEVTAARAALGLGSAVSVALA